MVLQHDYPVIGIAGFAKPHGQAEHRVWRAAIVPLTIPTGMLQRMAQVDTSAQVIDPTVWDFTVPIGLAALLMNWRMP